MGGGDLNLKKSWHPSIIKNQEQVWKAEQARDREQTKIEELKKEIREERQVEELQRAAENGGHVRKREARVEWMYRSSGSAGGHGATAEEYLQGKKIVLKQDPDTEKLSQAGINAKFKLKADAPVDEETVPALEQKMREDPMYAMKMRERESLARILDNPFRLAQIRKMRKEALGKDKKSKKSKKDKKDKKEKKKSKKSKKGTDSSGGDDDRDRTEANGRSKPESDGPRSSDRADRDRDRDHDREARLDAGRERGRDKDDRRRGTVNRGETRDSRDERDRRPRRGGRSPSPDARGRSDRVRDGATRIRSPSPRNDGERDRLQRPYDQERPSRWERRDGGVRRMPHVSGSYQGRAGSSKPKRATMSVEEKAARLAAMTKNAEDNEGDRTSFLQRYNAEEAAEIAAEVASREKHHKQRAEGVMGGEPAFVAKMQAHVAHGGGLTSLEDNLLRQRHYLSKTEDDLQRHKLV